MLAGMAAISGDRAAISIETGQLVDLPAVAQAAIGKNPIIKVALSIDGEPLEWSHPAAPVTVAIPYTPIGEELAHSESIVVSYVNNHGEMVTVPNGHYDSFTGMVIFMTSHFGDYVMGYNPVSFHDVNDNS